VLHPTRREARGVNGSGDAQRMLDAIARAHEHAIADVRVRDAEGGLLDQDFMHGRGVDTACDDRFELFDVVSDAAAMPAESEGRPNNQRQADIRQHLSRVVHVVNNA
jgi:hypothetical protein